MRLHKSLNNEKAYNMKWMPCLTSISTCCERSNGTEFSATALHYRIGFRQDDQNGAQRKKPVDYDSLNIILSIINLEVYVWLRKYNKNGRNNLVPSGNETVPQDKERAIPKLPRPRIINK